MDIEKLIRDAVKNKSDNIDLKLPNADTLWEKIQGQERLTNKKKREKMEFGITGWLEIAAVLLIIIFLPTAITKLRNLPVEQIAPSSNQETAATQAEIEEAKKTASSFLTEFYTIEDYASFTQQDEMLYPNDDKTKGIRIYTTDKYYMQILVPSRDLYLIVKAAQKNKCNFQVDKITLIKYTEDMKNKSIVFTSEVNLNARFIVGSEKPASFRGQITMQNENGKWKVNYYIVTSLEPKEIFNNVTESKINDIVQNYLPHPYNPLLTINTLSFRHKWAGSVMPEFTSQMENMGWKLYDGMGAKKFYKKEINGEEIKISIVTKEQGGPEEKDATTIITVKIEI